MADPQQSGDGAQGVTFSIDKIYIKDLSLENPGAPQSFLLQEQPQIEVGLAHAAASRSSRTSTNAC